MTEQSDYCSKHDFNLLTGYGECKGCKREQALLNKVLALFETGAPVETIITEYWNNEDYDQNDARQAIVEEIKKVF